MVALLLFGAGCASPSEEQLDLFAYNASDGIRSLDPAKATDLETMWVVDQLYEGLLELDTALQVVPALAKDWSISEDGLVYRFRLRDANFHDGTPVKAQDVVASFERLQDPAEALPGRWVLGGLERDGAEAIGDDSLELRLTAANPVFASLLATPQASVLRGGGRDVDVDREDLGTGPFLLRGWLPETALVMHANPTYWMVDEAGQPLPHLDGVRVEFNREEGSEMLGFQQGRYDFVSAPGPQWLDLFFDEHQQWRPQWQGRFDAHVTAYLKTDYIGWMVDSAGLAAIGRSPIHPDVRRALSMALDRESLVRELRAGGARPAV